MTDWQHISTAPKNATEVRAKMRDGTIHEKAHWAEDLSGSDQPPFKGWFVPRSDGFDGIQEPEFWMPVAEPAPPPTERFFRGDGVEEKVTYQPVTFAAARPEAQHRSGIAAYGTTLKVLAEIDKQSAAPQTSAEPLKCETCGSSDPSPGLCSSTWHLQSRRNAAPRPVSGDAPKVEALLITDARLEQIKQIRAYGLQAEPTALLLAIDDLLHALRPYFPASPKLSKELTADQIIDLIPFRRLRQVYEELKARDIGELATPASTARTDELRYTAKELIALIESPEWDAEYVDGDEDSYIKFLKKKLTTKE